MVEEYLLRTEGSFDSAHKLNKYDGKCSRLHGHFWKVIVWAKGAKLNETGLLWDFGNLKKILDPLDHQCLNDILMFNPTCENLADYILGQLRKSKDVKFKIRIYESPKNYCEKGDF